MITPCDRDCNISNNINKTPWKNNNIRSSMTEKYDPTKMPSAERVNGIETRIWSGKKYKRNKN